MPTETRDKVKEFRRHLSVTMAGAELVVGTMETARSCLAIAWVQLEKELGRDGALTYLNELMVEASMDAEAPLVPNQTLN